MEEVAFQQGHKERTESGYWKMGSGEEGRKYISKEGTSWAKARKQKSTRVWDEVGKEV